MTPELLERITALAARCETAANLEEFLSFNREFHLATFEATAMKRLRRLVEQFWNTTQHFRRAYLKPDTPDRSSIALAEHRLMLDAIQRRDPEQAAHILHLHIRRTRLELEHRMGSQTPESTKAAARRRADV
jgi:DNA-binding GntR family transcriptional regulator